MKIKMNNFKTSNLKKAELNLLSIWWFAILVVIAVGIVSSTLIFYSNKADVRLSEADILATKIIDCVSSDAFINERFLSKNFDVFKECSINQSIVNNSGNYYLKISLKKNDNLIQESKYGNSAFEIDCKIGASMIEAKNYPRCLQREVLLFDNNYEKYKLSILAGSNNEYRLEEKK